MPIAAYKKLDEIEGEIRLYDPDAKLVVRQAQRKPVFDELVAWEAGRAATAGPAP